MLKDKAQPILVDELSGRINEGDENRKESSRYSLMLLPLSENSSEQNLGYRRPAYFYLSSAIDSKRSLLEETWHGVIALDQK